jgi:glutathione synthase/RimK-type ligase-like ATP-grasp enzyme
LTVVGNPGNRRLTMFQAAVAARGWPAPTVVAWLDVLRHKAKPQPHSLVRVDSPGEDPVVDRVLRGAALAPGEIGGSRQWYHGFGIALHELAGAAAKVDAVLLNPPADVLTMFDKAASHHRLSRNAIPVAAAISAAPAGWSQLREAVSRRGWRQVFVKPRHASSASGVIALRFGPAGRLQATTSVEMAGGRLYNSLRVRRYTAERDIAAIVDRLAPDGLHVERWFPKAGLDGRTIDLRVLVIDGRPRHTVVRMNGSPMTNLHLGGGRGDLAAVAQRADLPAALETCAAAARCFPGSLHVAVDLMFSADWRRHAVAEVNAFGDLLPGITVDGHDAYSAQIEALTARLAHV